MANGLPRATFGKALRNISLSFVGLTLLLGAFIAYVAFSRAVIVVTLEPVKKDVLFRVTLAEDALNRIRPEGSVRATFLEATDSERGTFAPSGPASPTGKAGGLVTIKNETDRPQPLVATTRLLTAGGVLFRLKSAVRVPARGSVTATAEADQEGSAGEIGPSQFTIPGLSSTLQPVIYAVSNQAMVRGGASGKVVSEQDLETARQTLRQRIIERASQNFSLQVGAGKLGPQDFYTDTVEQGASVKAGATAASFTANVKLLVVGAAFDKAELLRRVAAEIGAKAVPVDEAVRYTVVSYNPVDRTAVLSGRASVGSDLSRGSSIFAPENFTGSTPDEVETFLGNYEGVKDVDVRLSPYWQRHLPRIPSRIRAEFVGQ